MRSLLPGTQVSSRERLATRGHARPGRHPARGRAGGASEGTSGGVDRVELMKAPEIVSEEGKERGGLAEEGRKDGEPER